MCRDDASFIADLQPVEGACGMLHRLPIGLASHDDADRPTGVAAWVASRSRHDRLLKGRLGLRKHPRERLTSARNPPSGDDVRQQFAFYFRDLVLDQELAFFHTLQL
jgi:hypothetical protein